MKEKKTILRICKVAFGKKDIECYMILEGHTQLPEIDQNKYSYTYYINSVFGYISLVWIKKE